MGITALSVVDLIPKPTQVTPRTHTLRKQWTGILSEYTSISAMFMQKLSLMGWNQKENHKVMLTVIQRPKSLFTNSQQATIMKVNWQFYTATVHTTHGSCCPGVWSLQASTPLGQSTSMVLSGFVFACH